MSLLIFSVLLKVENNEAIEIRQKKMSRSRRSSLGGSKDDFDKELAMVTEAVAVGLLDYDMQKLNRDWFPLEAAKATEAELIDTHCHLELSLSQDFIDGIGLCCQSDGMGAKLTKNHLCLIPGC